MIKSGLTLLLALSPVLMGMEVPTVKSLQLFENGAIGVNIYLYVDVVFLLKK